MCGPAVGGMVQRRCASGFARRSAPARHRSAAQAAGRRIFLRLASGDDWLSNQGRASCRGFPEPRLRVRHSVAHRSLRAATPCHPPPAQTGRCPLRRPVQPSPASARCHAPTCGENAATALSCLLPSVRPAPRQSPPPLAHPLARSHRIHAQFPVPAHHPRPDRTMQFRWPNVARAWGWHWRTPRQKRISFVHFMFY